MCTEEEQITKTENVILDAPEITRVARSFKIPGLGNIQIPGPGTIQEKMKKIEDAQKAVPPYVVLANGYNDANAWGLIGEQVGVKLMEMGAKYYGVGFKDDFRMVPWDSFIDGAGERYKTVPSRFGGFSISNDADFLKQGADFINNELDPRRPLIMIGHSFGGDSLLKLASRVNRRIQFLGVIDPVTTGGFRAPLTGRTVPSNVDYFFNRWEENPLSDGNIVPFDSRLVDGRIPSQAKYSDQSKLNNAGNADGSDIRDKCKWIEFCGNRTWSIPQGTKLRKIQHNDMPLDDRLNSQMITPINKALIDFWVSVDLKPPKVASFSPADNGTVRIDQNLIIDFDERIKKSTISNKNIKIKEYSPQGITAETIPINSNRITVTGTMVIIDPEKNLVPNKSYFVQIDDGAIVDLSNNAFTGIKDDKTWNLKTLEGPKAIGYSPDNGGKIQSTANLIIDFNQKIKRSFDFSSVGKKIVIKNSSDGSIFETIPMTFIEKFQVKPSSKVTIENNKLIINPTKNLDSNKSYYVEIESGAILDLKDNPFLGISGSATWNFKTDDSRPSIKSYNKPERTETNVKGNSDLILTFSEPIQKGVGNIIIKKLSDNSVIESVNVTSGNVTVSNNKIIVNPTNDLANNTSYYVEMSSGIVKDLAGNNFAGISDSFWEFSTSDTLAPKVKSFTPSNNESNIKPGAGLLIIFNESIEKGTGNIIIKKVSTNSIVESIDVASRNVTFGQNTIAINPTNNLLNSTSYYVEMSPGTAKDLVGNKFAGISGNSTWKFQTNNAPTAFDDFAITMGNTSNSLNIARNDTDVGGTITGFDLNPKVIGVQNNYSNTQGLFSVNNNGNLAFTPASRFIGTASLQYQAIDNLGATSNIAHVSIQVINQNPRAVNDIANTKSNQAVTVNIQGNDSDVDGNITGFDLNPVVSEIQNTLTTANGIFSVNNSGNLAFTPTNRFIGTASLKYQAIDNLGATSNITNVSIQVINQNPTAVNDIGNTISNQAVTVNIKENDNDIDGSITAFDINPLSIENYINENDINIGGGTDFDSRFLIIDNTLTTKNGAFSVDKNGNLAFTPASGFIGTASLQYQAIDNLGATSNISDVSIQVNNQNPIAVNDIGNTMSNQAVTVNIQGNDSDIDGSITGFDLNPLTSGIQDNTLTTENGIFSVDNSGNLAFTPTSGFIGTASLQYQAIDNLGATSNITDVSIQVNNQNPTAVNDIINTISNQAVTVNITGNNIDIDGNITGFDLNPLTSEVQNTLTTEKGLFSVDNSGNLAFTPATGFIGTGILQYQAIDNLGATSNIVDVSIQVSNRNPIAVNEIGNTLSNQAVTVNIKGNDSDIDGNITGFDLNPLTSEVQNTLTTANGIFSVDNSGNLAFTPASGFIGAASLQYQAIDNLGATSNITDVSIQVSNQNPIALNEIGNTLSNQAVTVNIKGNDSDTDGNITGFDLNPLTSGLQNTLTTANGVFSVNNSGNLAFTPTSGFIGTASLQYQAIDNLQGISNIADVIIQVSNQNPIAVNDIGNTMSNQTFTLNIKENDSDIDGNITGFDLNPLTSGVQNTLTTVNGVFSVDNIGNLAFTPASGFIGTASLAYQVIDNMGATSNTANVNIKKTFFVTSGADLIIGTANADIIDGLAGDDTINSLDGDDQLFGSDGKDYLDGGQGNDSMQGGMGDDTYFVDSINDKVSENLNSGNDIVFSTVNYTIPNNVERLSLFGSQPDKIATGGVSADYLIGSVLADKLIGNAGDDTMKGNQGNNTMTGGTGNDVYIVDQVGDVIEELVDGGNNDQIYSSVSYTMPTNVEKLYLVGTTTDRTVTGQGGNDYLIGSSVADKLIGNAGDDTLLGVDGNDTMIGEAGNDIMQGSIGADHFIYSTNTGFSTLAIGVDTITDFTKSEIDKIVLDKTTFNKISSIAGNGFSVAGEFASLTSNFDISGADIVYDSGTGQLFYNQNGTATGYGTGGHFITLSNKPALSASDFIIQA